MVRGMAGGIRLALVGGLALVVGAVGGAYGTRVIYGDGAQSPVEPAPRPIRECPACPACPACPPPPECGEVSLLPTQGNDPTAPPPETPPPLEPARPGLPAHAIQQALAAVRLAVGGCLAPDAAQGASGMLLLDLTVTTTGTTGQVVEALVTQRSGSVEAVEGCVQTSAKSARFPYQGPEGEQKVKLPLAVGR
jgi:hypothetical protein